MNLTNGNTLPFTFVTGEEAVKGMRECLLSVYGQKGNYVSPNMMGEDFLLESIQRGGTRLFAAISQDGTAAAAVAAKNNPHFEKSFEICSLAVRPEYRGFRLGDVITGHVLDECGRADSSLFYAHILMFHTRVSTIYEGKGFVPTGFLMGVCDARKHLSELSCHSRKHSWSVYVKNSGQSKPKTLYVSERLTGLIGNVYAALGTAPVIDSSDLNPFEGCHVEYEQDEYHKTLYIYVLTSGNSLREEVEAIERNYADELQTIVLFLNINDTGAVYGYETLKQSGYVLSGIKPLCGDHEYILMSKTKGVVIDTTEFQMTDALKSLFERIGEAG